MHDPNRRLTTLVRFNVRQTAKSRFNATSTSHHSPQLVVARAAEYYPCCDAATMMPNNKNPRLLVPVNKFVSLCIEKTRQEESADLDAHRQRTFYSMKMQTMPENVIARAPAPQRRGRLVETPLSRRAPEAGR